MAYAANRGKGLEKLVEMTNKQYAARDIAHINKIPTPWNVRFNPKTRSSSATPGEKSTVDFLGISNGRMIAFDTKETQEETRFDLKNVHEHQVKYLGKVHHHGGVAFLLIEFTTFKEIYILPYPALWEFWQRAAAGGRKSITYKEMQKFPQVTQGRGIVFDYLGVILGGDVRWNIS